MCDVLNIAVVNFKVLFGDKQANLSRIEEFTVACAKRGAELILFPEMCLMGYDYFIDSNITMEEKVAVTETVTGPSVRLLEALAKKLGIWLVFGMSEKSMNSDELYNAAVALAPDGLSGVYRKIHPYGAENTWCKKGESPFLLITKWGPVGIGVCYDNYQFPELTRYYVHKGARLLLNPTAVNEEVGKEGSRRQFIRSYTPHLEYLVLSSSIFVASANLTGYDHTSFFGGGSMIIGPKTNAFEEVDVVRYCGDDDNYQVGAYIGTVDLSLATRHQCQTNPYCGEPDYRPDIYRRLFIE